MRQSALLASLLLAIPAASHALGFGRVANNTVLGQPLDVSVVVSAEPNQDPPLGCVHAEVFAGDSRLPSSAVNVRLDGASGAEPALIRVGSAVRIDEPVVTVVLTVGCASRLSRSFVLFVDPPVVGGPNGDPSTLASAERSDAQPPWLVGQAATMPTDVGSIQAQSQAQTQAAAQPADPAATGGPKRARPGGASSGKSELRKLDTDRPKEGSSARDQAEKEAAAATRKARRLAALKAKEAKEADRAASRDGSSRAGSGKEGGSKSGDRKLADAADGSRLRLEAPEALSAPIPTAPAPAASMAALAASVAMASELAASQAESLEQAQRKIRDLEADLQRLRSLIASAPAPVAPVKAPAATRTGASWLGQDVWAIGASALVALLLVGLYALWRRARGSDEESLWWATQVGPTGRKAPELDGESMAVSQMEPPMTENGPAAYSDDPGLRQAQPAPLEQDSTFEPPPGSTAVPGVRRNEFATSEFSTFRSANSLMDGLRVISSPPTVPSFVFAAPPLPPPDLGPPLSASMPAPGGSSKAPAAAAAPLPLTPAIGDFDQAPSLDLEFPQAQLPELGGALSQFGAPSDQLAPIAMTVDELLDLEQQVDFFLVLGQDNDAIDLLMSHVGGAGSMSPIPYLKLLDIYRMQGDQPAFERVGERFAQRFGVAPPHWHLDGLQPRSIEQYPAALEDLSQHWASASRALAWLEVAIFRSGDLGKVFDLQAYDDLIFLYLVARDLVSTGSTESQGLIDLDLAAGSDADESPVFAKLSASATRPMDPQPNLGHDLDIDLNA